MKVAIFESLSPRFELMKQKLTEESISFDIFNFDSPDWLNTDFSIYQAIYLYPKFLNDSGSPDCLLDVKDNLKYIASKYPSIAMFPDPKGFEFYNDKYKQFLFLKDNDFSIPATYPCFSDKTINIVKDKLEFPLIVKNRYGAGGDFVFSVNTIEDVRSLFHKSFRKVDFKAFVNRLWADLKKQVFKIHPTGYRYCETPLSMPLLLQKKIPINRDLRVVMVNGKVWEAHWRVINEPGGYKANIDGGADGVWSAIPKNIIEECERLAKLVKVRWLGIDILYNDQTNEYFFTEFSPVWHHYKINEKDNFRYERDYNIFTDLEEGHDFEGMIVKTLIDKDFEYPVQSLK